VNSISCKTKLSLQIVAGLFICLSIGCKGASSSAGGPSPAPASPTPSPGPASAGSPTPATSAAADPHLKVASAGIWVVNSGYALKQPSTISRIDGTTMKVVNTFTAPEEHPQGDEIEMNPTMALYCNGSVWIGSYGYNTIEQIDPSHNQVLQRIAKVSNDSGLTCSGGSIAAVSAVDSATLVDSGSAKLTNLSLATPGAGVITNQTGVWILTLTGDLMLMDLTKWTAIKSINFKTPGSDYLAVGLTNNGPLSNHTWIAAKNFLTSKTSLIRFETDKQVFSYYLDLNVPGLSDSSIGFGQRLDIIEANNMIWLPLPSLNVVLRANATTGAYIDQLPAGKSPVGLAFDGTNVWVTNYNDNTVMKLDGKTGKVLGTIPVGLNPLRVVVSP
jgi:YVTN family beta-propeller protein